MLQLSGPSIGVMQKQHAESLNTCTFHLISTEPEPRANNGLHGGREGSSGRLDCIQCYTVQYPRARSCLLLYFR